MSTTQTEEVLTNSTIKNRGPDCTGSHCATISKDVSMLFGGFVLHLRGGVTPQPLKDDKDNILLWNGEIFGGMTLKEDDNDTRALFDKLTQARGEQDILDALTCLQGPWAFIFWQENAYKSPKEDVYSIDLKPLQAKEKKLWFGRDVFGRRSLLWHLPENDTDVFALSSVQIQPHENAYKSPKEDVYSIDLKPLQENAYKSPKEDVYSIDLKPLQSFQEVTSVGLFCLDFSYTDRQLPTADNGLNMTVFPWKDGTWPGTIDPVKPEHFSDKLYQGSICVKVTLQADVELPSWMPVVNNELPPLDHQQMIPEGLTATNDSEGMYREHLSSILDNDSVMRSAVKQLMDVLMKAVQRRVYNLPRESRTLQNDSESKVGKTADVVEDFKNVQISKTSDGVGDGDEMRTEHIDGKAKVAVLFSGGIDSTVIAALADRCVPPDETIDLINVAFEQLPKMTTPQNRKKEGIKQKSDPSSASPVDRFGVPDRVTGYVALSELNPDRKWNFVEVNITQEELKEFRNQYVRHLIYPLTSVLDDSIGCAVWFAARGRGILGNGQHKGQAYKSSAKVILCGMGADEQLAGYSRHRVRFRDRGWQGVINEVDMEMKRISARNLGRDDRIIGDHGRESRFPFLDEEVVAYLAHLPMHIKADLSLPRGVGEKLILRLLALILGLPSTAVLPKRAIQFGSRIAKIENSKEKASDVCTRLKDTSDTMAE